jgi:integrase
LIAINRQNSLVLYGLVYGNRSLYFRLLAEAQGFELTMPIRKERALSPLFCKNAPVGFHCDGGGLYLSAKPLKEGDGVSRSWIFRYRRLGRLRDLGLGPLSTVSLSTARDRARQSRQKLLDGVDPIEERKAARVAAAINAARRMTFEQCAESYIEANRAGWKSAKHADQWRSTLLTYAYPIIGTLPVDAVEDVHVLKIIQPIWTTKTETANRVRGRIEKVLDRAKALKLRSGENPARWTGHLDQLLPRRSQVAPVEHHEALPYAELPQFMAELVKLESLSALALEFTVLTAARTGDTIGAVHSEIDLKERTWTIPAARLKGKKGARKRDHVVPLCDRALAIIRKLPEPGGHLFASDDGFPLSDMAMLECLRGLRPGLTVHGFRSTFKDWASEMTAYPNELSELALAHTVSDKVEAAYRRGDMREKRRRMMSDWAAFAANRRGKNLSRVVPMRPKTTVK